MLQHFIQEASAKGARSTALHPLQWGLGMSLAAIPVTILAGAPAWVFTCLLVLVAVIGVSFLIAYFYFLKNDPDALRSESFTLSKMAIEKGLVGDSLVGLGAEPEQLGRLRDDRVVNDEGQSQ